MDLGSSHPVLLIWAFILLFLLVLAAARFFRTTRIQRAEIWAALFLLVCAAHGLIIGAASGPTTGIFAFLAWGISIGVFFQVGRAASCDGPQFVIYMLVLGGVINAAPVIWESVNGIAIFKAVTVANQTRLYGISQSISILGLQLAVGIIASMYLLLTSKRKIVVSAILILQFWALIFSTSRGPLIYMIIALVIITSLLPSSPEKKMFWALLLGSLISFLLFLILIFPIQIANESKLSFLLTALTGGDTGNNERIGYYLEALDLLFSNFTELILGRGAGMLSLVEARSGGYETNVESSVLKLFLELGVIGAVPFFAVVVSLLGTGLRNWTRKRDMRSLFLLGCFMVVLLQMTTQELLKAWIGSVYFWLIAGGLLHAKLIDRDFHRLERAKY